MDKLNNYCCLIALKLTPIDCLKPTDYFDITFIKVNVVFDFLEIFKDKWVDLEFHPLLIIYSIHSVKSGLRFVYTAHALRLLDPVIRAVTERCSLALQLKVCSF